MGSYLLEILKKTTLTMLIMMFAITINKMITFPFLK